MSMIALPVARLPRIRNGSLLLIATSNFQSRSGGFGNESVGAAEGGSGCGAGRPGRPIGMMSMFFRKRLFVVSTCPLTLALFSGPTTLMSASTRAVRSSFRATSTLFALSRRSKFGSVNFGKVIEPLSGEGPAREIAAEAVEAEPCCRRKLSSALKFVRAGRVAFSKRATLMFMSADPLRSGLAIVPRDVDVERDRAVELVERGTNCRTKLTELRGI